MTDKKINNLFLWILLFLIAIFLFSEKNLNVNLSGNDKSNIINITGEAKKSVSPDIVRINFTVSEKSKRQDESSERVNKRVNEIIDKIRDLGISKKDIKTLSYNIYPQYNWIKGKSEFVGYNVSQRVEIKNDNFDLTSDILSILTEARVDNLNGPYFEVEKIDEIKEELREEAIDDAKEKAEKIADELGINLTKIVSFREVEEYEKPYLVRNFDASFSAPMAKMESPEIYEGEEEIVKKVIIGFEIEN